MMYSHVSYYESKYEMWKDLFHGVCHRNNSGSEMDCNPITFGCLHQNQTSFKGLWQFWVWNE